MAKFFDENGNEVSGVLTQEEFNAKLTEEKTRIETDFVAKNTALEQELNSAKEALKIANPKGEEFKQLREITKNLEAKIESERNERVKALDTVRSSKVSELVKKLAGNDVEMEKKIRFNMDTTLAAVKAETDEELNKKIVDAYRLSSNSDTINPLTNIMNGGSYSPVNNNSNPVEFTQNQKELGSKLGLSDADIKKYGADPRINK